MSGIRKIIAILIIFCIGIPSLVFSIYFLTIKGLNETDKLTTSLPKKIIDKIPSILDETMVELEKSDIEDNTRKWLKAIKKSDISFKEYMQKTGVKNWLKSETSKIVVDINKVAIGKKKLNSLFIDMKGFKIAMEHEIHGEYIKKILLNLPKCSSKELFLWAKFVINPSKAKLPGCSPPDMGKIVNDIVNATNVLRLIKLREIPNKISLAKNYEELPLIIESIKKIKFLNQLGYFIILIPLIIILCGFWLATFRLKKIIKWSGLSISFGGAITYILTKFILQNLPALRELPESFVYVNKISPQIQNILLNKVNHLISIIAQSVFLPIFMVSIWVIGAGILIFLLSMIMRRGRDSNPGRL